MGVEAKSTTVLSSQSPIVGIKAETSYGVSLDSSGADGTTYRQLNVLQASPPTIERVRESRLLSGAGLVKNSGDSITINGGGSVSMPFDMLATPKLTSQMLTLVCQEVSWGSSIATHEIGGQATEVNSIGASVSGNLPASVQIAYSTGTAGEGMRINGAIVSELTMAMSAGSNNNLMSLSGNFYSGHSFMGTGDSLTTSGIEQTFSAMTAPETAYYSMANISSAFLSVDDDSDGREIILKDFSLTISNGANRGGFNSVGDAVYLAIPELTVTGSMSIKYDANFDYGAVTNILQDFINGSTELLTIKIGDGTADAVGEMNISMNIQYTGNGLDLSEAGVYHTLEFECVSTGTGDGNEALQIVNFNNENITAW